MIQTLTKSEMEIMSTMWLADKPLSRNEIIELSPDRSWKASSIHILLNGLLEKQAIVVSGFEKSRSHYGRVFEPAYDEATYVAMQIRQMESYKSFQAKAVKSVISALLDDTDIDDETITELENLVKEKRTEK